MSYKSEHIANLVSSNTAANNLDVHISSGRSAKQYSSEERSPGVAIRHRDDSSLDLMGPSHKAGLSNQFTSNLLQTERICLRGNGNKNE